MRAKTHIAHGSVARVWRRGDRPPSQGKISWSIWQMWRDKEFLSLISKIWTGGRHLVF